MVDLDSYLALHANALLLREQRSVQLAKNLTNVDTPNYHAKDIDFTSALNKAMATSHPMVTNDPNHINVSTPFSSELKYRQTNQMSLDGNTVDKDLETIEFTKNTISYQASLTFLEQKIRTMMTAIRGE